MSDGAPPDPPDLPAPPSRPLLAPADGVPPIVAAREDLDVVVEGLKAGAGPVGVDAERASGYRYGQRAFLVQLRRQGAGTSLIDPVAVPDLSAVGSALADSEWVLHAASQDLPCLAEVGMRPTRLFDTELAARLAGLPRVGLGAVVQELLGFELAKEHSAVDWSVRPLPESWLRYAALDVELLVDLRDALGALLAGQGKSEWARQEFQAILDAPPPTPRTDPWRRTSGLHKVRGRRHLAAVRELWNAREDLARRRDVSPGRLLPDAAIVDAAIQLPADEAALAALPVFRGRANRRLGAHWLAALDRARALPDSALPPAAISSDAPPPPRTWADRDPDAAARLAAARAALTELSEKHVVPVENLLQPDTVRRLAWQPPEPLDGGTLADALRRSGAREWQVELTGPVLLAALGERA